MATQVIDIAANPGGDVADIEDRLPAANTAELALVAPTLSERIANFRKSGKNDMAETIERMAERFLEAMNQWSPDNLALAEQSLAEGFGLFDPEHAIARVELHRAQLFGAGDNYQQRLHRMFYLSLGFRRVRSATSVELETYFNAAQALLDPAVAVYEQPSSSPETVLIWPTTAERVDAQRVQFTYPEMPRLDPAKSMPQFD